MPDREIGSRASTPSLFAAAIGGALAAAIALTLVAAPRAARADGRLADYRAESDILGASPSTEDGAISALFNPAQWGVPERGELAVWWSEDDDVPGDPPSSWGFSMGRGVGFSMRRQVVSRFLDRVNAFDDQPVAVERHAVEDYQIGLGGGSGAAFGGIALGWSGGETDRAGRTSFVSLGTIHRPAPWLSIGSASRIALGDDDLGGVLDVGVRPLANPRVALFADYALTRRNRWDEGSLGGGVLVRPIDGLAASIKWDDGERVQIALGVTTHRLGLGALARDDDAGDYELRRAVVRFNPPLRDLPIRARRAARRPRSFIEIDLNGSVVYQRRRFGDDGALALRGITRQIQTAIDEPTVGGVAVNLSGLRANPEMLWEIREKLVALRAAGKKVLVYADRLDIHGYFLASIADRIVIDPQGDLTLAGVQMSRTYQKEMLAKIGLGFEELRYFKYKSAMEAFSRTSMSDADREQRQELVDDAYEELAGGIAAGGRVSRAEVDRIVNEEPIVLPKRALALGLVDRLGHWEDAGELADTLAGRDVALVSHRAVAARHAQPDEAWGAPPVIALVYAVGECAMDSGIRGRATSKAMKAFRKRGDVKAVVLRADSPGGDPLPSDLVAHETRELRKANKPVVVSQGRVAASGGYWISADADSILVSPFSITGSIGVIAAWVWNDSLGAKLGLAYDRVQVGRSADLLGGLRLPLLGATLPPRPFTDAERALAKSSVLTLYDEFTEGVAAARRLDVAYVREVAEGRVYLGRRGVEKRIVDRVGTLDDAIEAARKAAGIREGRRVKVVEYPKPPLISWPRLFTLPGMPLGALARAADVAEPAPAPKSYEDLWLERVVASPARPLLLAPSGLLPDEEAATR
jgi:protease-4